MVLDAKQRPRRDDAGLTQSATEPLASIPGDVHEPRRSRKRGTDRRAESFRERHHYGIGARGVLAHRHARRAASSGLLVSVWTASRIRVVTHLDATAEAVDEAARIMREVLERG